MSSKVFASVKAYSKRGRLLEKSELQTLAESRDLDELVTRIKNTVYTNAVSEVQKPYTAEKIESALRSHLADIHYSIAKTAASSTVLDAYFLKFMTWNLKLILKGKVLGKSQEEIESHINLHAEELVKQRDVILKALVAKDLEEAVSSLSGTVFGEEVAKAVAAYNETKNIQVFDTYFDKILIQQLNGALKKSGDKDLSRPVSMDIDFYNLLSVVRGKFWKLSEQQIQELIVTYTASAPSDLIGRMIAAPSVRDALNELTSTSYRELVPQSETDIDAISGFEHAFEMAIFNKAKNTFTRMFSSATSVGIAKLTAFEVRNIGSIAYAVEQKIPVQTTMSKLIVDQ
ncbi:MAG TPA: V-type ATPase subunit [Nitrosopumilaceae archaeon]|nr:V-type ATPase subunit [Nitrosopumilaceae archaeon]